MIRPRHSRVIASQYFVTDRPTKAEAEHLCWTEEPSSHKACFHPRLQVIRVCSKPSRYGRRQKIVRYASFNRPLGSKATDASENNDRTTLQIAPLCTTLGKNLSETVQSDGGYFARERWKVHQSKGPGHCNSTFCTYLCARKGWINHTEPISRNRNRVYLKLPTLLFTTCRLDCI